MPLDPEHSRQLGQQARLWLLSLICATVGALVVWQTGRLPPGILAFLITLAVLGLALYLYEEAKKRAPKR